jgi:hypothetical protein
MAQFLSILILVLYGGKWSVVYPNHITPREIKPSNFLTGDWVGPSAGLDVADKKEISYPCQEWMHNISPFHPIAWSVY